MFSASTILQVYMAPRDAYSYVNFRNFHMMTKRRWRDGQVMGGAEIRELENNSSHDDGYNRPIKIRGWNHGVDSTSGRTWKTANQYVEFVGDPYFDYYEKFTKQVVGWWGVRTEPKHRAKLKRNEKNVYIPNTPMFDPSVHLEKNSVMKKLYIDGMDFEEAYTTTRRGASKEMSIMKDLKAVNMELGMSEEEAIEKSKKSFFIYMRNKAMVDNPMLDNDYNFTINYYNKYIDKKIREMMPIKISFWFLKEAMKNNPNLSFYVLGPYNMLSRIHGIVSKRNQNVVIKMAGSKQAKEAFDYVYSVSKDTYVNETNRGFIPARKLSPSRSKISNALKGGKQLKVEKRFNSEIFYDMILDGKTFRGYSPWFDSHHNCWLTPDYSNPKYLKGTTVVC